MRGLRTYLITWSGLCVAGLLSAAGCYNTPVNTSEYATGPAAIA